MNYVNFYIIKFIIKKNYVTNRILFETNASAEKRHTTIYCGKKKLKHAAHPLEE